MLWAVTALMVAQAPTPPPKLECLTRYYAGKAELRNGVWFLVLADGSAHRFDDGRKKTVDEADADPDPEDMFQVPYRPGAIRPVTDPDDDPGRIRFDPLFFATYGRSAKEVDLVSTTFFGTRVKIHRRIAGPFAGVVKRLEAAVQKKPSLDPFLREIGGTFQWRAIAGTSRQSSHSFGTAIDLNVKRANYWQWQRPREPLVWRNQYPQEIVDAFEAEGFIWGGRWYIYDTMHFEYRPELLDPTCRAG